MKMAKCRVIAAIIFAIIAVVVYKKIVATFYEIPPVPELHDTWWGPREPSKEDTEIRPFKISVPDEV